MKTLYLECLSGIAGDMTVAALLDAGGNQDGLFSLLHSLPIDGYELNLSRVMKNGIAANYFDVHLHNHHHHDHHDHDHRGLHEINEIIEKSGLTETAKRTAKDMFHRLALAEAKVHGTTPEQVHFHEVGAVDSIIDIISVAYLIDDMKIERVISSPLYEGTGTTKCQHGIIPIPAPATAELFLMASIPFVITPDPYEKVTPTGAAIIATLAQSFGQPSITNLSAIGIGAGKRDTEKANVLRAYLYNSTEQEQVIEITTAIDDSTGEQLSFLSEALFEKGALDVYFTPIYMKKNRPAFQLTVLCNEENQSSIATLIFRHSGTIGMRVKQTDRIIMERKQGVVNTKYGEIEVKQCRYGDVEKTTVEYEAAKKAAKQHDVSIAEIYTETMHKTGNDFIQK